MGLKLRGFGEFRKRKSKSGREFHEFQHMRCRPYKGGGGSGGGGGGAYVSSFHIKK